MGTAREGICRASCLREKEQAVNRLMYEFSKKILTTKNRQIQNISRDVDHLEPYHIVCALCYYQLV